jgi:hypothetical protein
MTNQQHPITPTTELAHEWWGSTIPNQSTSVVYQLCTQAAQWGADQELEACGRWIEDQLCMPPDARADVITKLNGSRRPKPPSLKEQALEVVTGLEKRCDLQCDLACVRLALEALPND